MYSRKNVNTVSSILCKFCADNMISFADIGRYLGISASNVTIWGSRFGAMPIKHYQALLNHPEWNTEILVKFKEQLTNHAPIGDEQDFLPLPKPSIKEDEMLPVISEEYLSKFSTIKESIAINERMLPHRPRPFGGIECDFYVTAPCDFEDIRKGDLLFVASDGCDEDSVCVYKVERHLEIKRGIPAGESYRVTGLTRIIR